MIIKLETKINISKFIDYLEFVKKSYPPFMKKNGPWGGWSITSSNGDVYDGWQAGEKAHDAKTSTEEIRRIHDFFANSQFNTPTQIYTSEFGEILKSIQSELPNLILNRLRIAVLKPHSEEEAYWHKDSDGSNVFRLHIPIITNDLCFFDYSDERHNLKADGSIYIINIGKLHRAVNLSNEDRFHFIANIHKF